MQVSPSCAGRTPLEGDVVSQLPSLSETFPHLPMVCISFPPTLLLMDSLVSVTRNVRMVAIQGDIFFFSTHRTSSSMSGHIFKNG